MVQSTGRIPGIDPGLQALGYGIIDAQGRNARVVDYGELPHPPKIPCRNVCIRFTREWRR